VVDENTCPEPFHPYATSHRAAEDIVRAQHKAGTMRGLVVRLSNAFGAPADLSADCWSLLINGLTLQAVRALRMSLSTTGRQRRDFVPLSEVCRALSHLLQIPGSVNDVINLGAGWAPTALEVAGLIATRTEAVLFVRPEISLGVVTDEVGLNPLDYRIGRLRATGFELHDRENCVLQELDELIEFCRRNAKDIPSCDP
jgi:UDP-glucose 4-epimerase